MSISVVTTDRKAAGGASSITSNALSMTTTDLVVVWAYWEDTTKTVTISDSGSHAWTSKTQVTNGSSNRCQMWYTYGAGITSGGPTITMTLSSGTALLNMEIFQIAGTATASDPFDTQATATGTGSAMTSGAFTTTTANEIICVGGFQVGSGGCDTTGSIGGTTATLATCTGEYLIVSSTQNNITATINNGAAQAWVMSVATFTQAGGAAARGLFLNDLMAGMGVGGSFFRNPLG